MLNFFINPFCWKVGDVIWMQAEDWRKTASCHGFELRNDARWNSVFRQCVIFLLKSTENNFKKIIIVFDRYIFFIILSHIFFNILPFCDIRVRWKNTFSRLISRLFLLILIKSISKYLSNHYLFLWNNLCMTWVIYIYLIL